MRGKGREFREDFEGVYLLRTEFPHQTDPEAIDQVKRHDRDIKIFASKLFTKNSPLFHRVGLDRYDVESIVRVYTYIYFGGVKKTHRHLQSHLKFRATKLLRTCVRKIEGIAGEMSTITDSQLDDLYDYYGHNDTPENILIAHERIERITSGIEKKPE